MSRIPGGSAYNWARDIGEGYHTVSDRSFKGLAVTELNQVAFELDRALREIRGENTAVDDLQAVQKRNRKILRLQTAMVVLQAHRRKSRR